MTMCSYSEQVEDIEHCASIGEDLKLKWTNSRLIKCFLWTFGTLNTTEQSVGDDFDANMNSFQMYQMVIHWNFCYIKHYGARVGDAFCCQK